MNSTFLWVVAFSFVISHAAWASGRPNVEGRNGDSHCAPSLVAGVGSENRSLVVPQQISRKEAAIGTNGGLPQPNQRLLLASEISAIVCTGSLIDRGRCREFIAPDDSRYHDNEPALRGRGADRPAVRPEGKAEAISPRRIPADTLAPEPPAGSRQDSSAEDLIRDMDNPKWEVRWRAVNELGKLKEQRAIPALVRRAIHDDNHHPRWRSLWALKGIDSSGSDVVPALLTALQDPDPVVARNAAVGLAHFGRPDARPNLLQGLNDPDPFRRWEAVFSLGKIGSPDVAGALVPLLTKDREPDARVRGEVALALSGMQSQEFIDPLLNALKRDPNSAVRWRAAMTLSKIGASAVAGDIEEALANETDGRVKEYYRRALRRVGDPSHPH